MMRTLTLGFAALALFFFTACGDDDRRIDPDAGTDAAMGDGGGMDAGRDAGMDGGGMDAGPDDAGDVDGGDVDGGTMDDAGLTPTDMIVALVAMADGTGLSVLLEHVLVAYVRPAGGGEPAGFFVQTSSTGPAIFVAVDPTTTAPTVDVGDELSFTVIDLTTVSGQRRVTAITGLAELSTGVDVTPLVRDVSAATDLVSALDDYESERIQLTFTVAADFTGAGTGFVAAPIDTAGLSGETALRFRVPASIATALDLGVGCELEIDGVMWRFTTNAQPSVYEDTFITSVMCPAPAVTSAVAASDTEVVVSFDRAIDPASVTDASTQLTIVDSATAALAVSAASVSGSTVTLTTATQTAGETYTVTVANTVTDLLGAGVDATMNTATFTGFTPPASRVIINEVDYDQPSTDAAEFVELHNPGTSAVDLTGHELAFVNGNASPPVDYRIVALSGSIAGGEYIVVANPGSVAVPSGVTVIAIGAATNAIQNGGSTPDGVALLDASGALLDALSYDGSITDATIDGTTGYNLVEGTATAAVDVADGSLSRIPNGSDTDDAATDWQFVSAPTPGAANTP